MEIKIAKELHFDAISTAIIVVGVGGTGSQLVTHVARLLKAKRSSVKTKLHLIDGDIVEDKNLIRQNFMASDINKNKAATLASKLSGGFGMTVSYTPEYINKDTLSQLVQTYAGEFDSIIVVGCSDSNECRRTIHNVLVDCTKYVNSDLLYIDAGNEEFGGQVVLGMYKHSAPYADELSILPSVVEMYPNIANDVDVATADISCAERAQSNPQAAEANLTAAMLLMQMISNYFAGEIITHQVFFATRTNGFTSYPLYPDYIESLNLEDLSKSRTR